MNDQCERIQESIRRLLKNQSEDEMLIHEVNEHLQSCDACMRFFSVAQSLKRKNDDEEELDTELLQAIAQLPPMERMVRLILLRSLLDGSDEVWLAPVGEALSVRFTIEGETQEALSIPGALAEELKAEIKRQANEQNVLEAPLHAKTFRFKLESLSAPQGEAMHLKLIYS